MKVKVNKDEVRITIDVEEDDLDPSRAFEDSDVVTYINVRREETEWGMVLRNRDSRVSRCLR